MIYGVGGVFILLMVVLFLTYAGGASYSGAGYNFSAGISIGFFVGLITAAAVAVGAWLSKTDPQPATAPLRLQPGPAGAASRAFDAGERHRGPPSPTGRWPSALAVRRNQFNGAVRIVSPRRGAAPV